MTNPSETNHLLERYRKLNDLARNLASTLDLASLLNRIVHAAADLSNAQAASILLYYEKDQTLQFETTTNLEEPLMLGVTVPVDDSIAGWIVSNRQPIIIQDVKDDPRHYEEITDATAIVTESLLGVPLVAKGKVIGVLEAINKANGNFTPEDQDLLMALGAQAAIAIENARLFQQSDLISELVHEIRSPLTSINTAARLLGNPDFPKESHANIVDMILKESQRLGEMTSDFLDLARLESGRANYTLEKIEVTPLLKNCVAQIEPQAQEKDISVNIETPHSLPMLQGDPDKIKQVFINLLSNAVKYNRPGGWVVVHAAASQEKLRIEVEDNGIGIAEESQAQLFEKFFRVPSSASSAQGTGLGLYISKRIVEDHGGNIEVQSQAGEGTSIVLQFPL